MNEPLFDKEIFRKALSAFLGGETPKHTEVLEAVENWMDSGKPGLVLMGSVGTGKTTIAYALRYAWQQFLTIARIYKCDEVARLIEADKSWIKEVASCSGLLILDDLGTEKKIYGEEVIPYIIYQRYERRMPTIITTNYNTEKIRERYGERIADRLRTYSRIIMNYDSLR